MQSFDPIIKKVDGTWIRITTSDIDQFSGSSDLKAEKCSEAVQQLRLSKDDQSQMKKLFDQNQFIEAKEVYDNQAIDGDTNFHYLIDFNDKHAQQFIKSAVKLQSFKQVVEDCDIDIEDIGKTNSSSEDKPEEVKFELWVSTNTRRFTKIRVQVSDKELTLDFDSKVKFDAQNVTIEKPSEFITIEQLQNDIQALMLGM